jgi:hypothetical protein
VQEPVNYAFMNIVEASVPITTRVINIAFILSPVILPFLHLFWTAVAVSTVSKLGVNTASGPMSDFP